MSRSDNYNAINQIARFATRRLKLPIHEHRPYESIASRFDGIWLQPDGLHIVKSKLDAGQFAHEIGHAQLMRPADRSRVKPGCLDDQGIRTCLTDLGAEAYACGIFIELDLPLELLFSHLSDFSWTLGVKQEDSLDDDQAYFARLRMGVNVLQGESVGIKLFQMCGMMSPGRHPKMLTWTPTQRAWDVTDSISREASKLDPNNILLGT